MNSMDTYDELIHMWRFVSDSEEMGPPIFLQKMITRMELCVAVSVGLWVEKLKQRLKY